LLFAAALLSVISIGLLGCGAQSDPPRMRYVQVAEVNRSAGLPAISTPDPIGEGIDYDPWEPFNEKTFWFNHDVLDRYALKPAATVWAKTLPDPVRRSLANAFDNIAMPRRLVNKVLQGRFESAGQEVARFVVNTTVGVAGFFDVATLAGLKKSDADTGQTLGLYGAGPGPYLVVPLLPPLDARDAIGYAADSLMDPLSIFVTPIFADIGRAAGKTVNERAANLKLYQDAEDTSLDLYAAVRNGYLQRRQQAIEDAIRDLERAEEGRESLVRQQSGSGRD